MKTLREVTVGAYEFTGWLDTEQGSQEVVGTFDVVFTGNDFEIRIERLSLPESILKVVDTEALQDVIAAKVDMLTLLDNYEEKVVQRRGWYEDV